MIVVPFFIFYIVFYSQSVSHMKLWFCLDVEGVQFCWLNRYLCSILDGWSSRALSNKINLIGGLHSVIAERNDNKTVLGKMMRGREGRSVICVQLNFDYITGRPVQTQVNRKWCCNICVCVVVCFLCIYSLITFQRCRRYFIYEYIFQFFVFV